eukprot:Polyplicarium_translucidae@DN5329_c0_g1_i1.p1
MPRSASPPSARRREETSSRRERTRLSSLEDDERRSSRRSDGRGARRDESGASDDRRQESRGRDRNHDSDTGSKSRESRHSRTKHRDERSRSRSRSREDRKRKDDEKHKKKREKGKRKEHSLTVTHQWGKYGIIQETDLWNRKPEFYLWLMEVKNRSSESLPLWEEKQLFKEFVEDFNTATFPHKKYYSLEKWEAKQAMKKLTKQNRGGGELTVFDDEAARKTEIQMLRDKRSREALVSTYQEMKQDSEKVLAMKRQRGLKEQMEMLFRQGRNEEATKIQNLLKPDEQ